MSLKERQLIEGDLLVLGKIYSENGGGSGGSHSLQNLHLIQEGSTLISVESVKQEHYHVLVEYETNGVHHGASVDLHPYNNSICLSYYLIGESILTGYIDEEGHIVLAIPSGITPTNIICHYFAY